MSTHIIRENYLRIIIKYPSLANSLTLVYVKKPPIQSTLVISNFKGLSKILRDIRTSTYQICRIEEKIIRTTTFNKFVCNWTLEVMDIVKILWKRGELSFSQYFHLLLDFHV